MILRTFYLCSHFQNVWRKKIEWGAVNDTLVCACTWLVDSICWCLRFKNRWLSKSIETWLVSDYESSSSIQLSLLKVWTLSAQSCCGQQRSLWPDWSSVVEGFYLVAMSKCISRLVVHIFMLIWSSVLPASLAWLQKGQPRLCPWMLYGTPWCYPPSRWAVFSTIWWLLTLWSDPLYRLNSLFLAKTLFVASYWAHASDCLWGWLMFLHCLFHSP